MLPDMNEISTIIARHDGAYPYDGLQICGMVIIIVLATISMAVCSLRVYSRVRQQTFGLDDWLICVATVVIVVQCWAANMSIHYGYIGIHAVNIPPNRDRSKEYLYSYLSLVFYTPILPLVKLSILVFLYRIGGRTSRAIRIAILSLIAFNSAQLVALVTVRIFQCRPISLIWTTSPADRASRCIVPGVFTLSIASLNIFTDFLLLILPFRIFRVIKINKRMRNAWIGAFALGICVTVVSIGRLYCMWRLFYVVEADPTYSIRFTLSQIETNLAVVAASAPPLWPLARRWFPSMDAKLGINDPHYPDIEVNMYSTSGTETEKLAKPMKVKVTWRKGMSSPTGTDPEGYGGSGGVLESPRGSVRRLSPDCLGSEQEARSDWYHHALTGRGPEDQARKL